ncbi:hypothetical protein VPHD518_0044 [Vibrio phage D518]
MPKQHGKDDIDKALEMLKLLHPESYENLMGVIGTIVADIRTLENRIDAQSGTIDVLMTKIDVLEKNQQAAWSHAMSKPRPS